MKKFVNIIKYYIGKFMKNNRFILNCIINVTICVVLIMVAFTAFDNTVGVSLQENKAIYRGNVNEKKVSLMFNVYWGTEYIAPILNVLDKYNIKTTFFLGGSWAAKNNGLVKEIASRGHEIGSHGYSHKEAEKIGYKQNLDEIILTDRLLENLLGQTPKLFAPPSGSISKDMFRACEETEKLVIMWSRDTIDWRDKDSELIYKRATLDIQNGDLVLMHPTAETLKSLPKIIEQIQKLHLTITTVSDCIKETSL